MATMMSPTPATVTPATVIMAAVAVPARTESEVNAWRRSAHNRCGRINGGLVNRWVIRRGGLVHHRRARHYRGRERETKPETDANPTSLGRDRRPEQDSG